MSLPLQHTKGRETASHMMELCPRGAGLTACQPELILTNTDHLLDLGADTVQATDLCSRQGEAIGGKILGAVSDNQDFQAPSQLTGLRPIGMAPVSRSGWSLNRRFFFRRQTKYQP